LHILQTSLTKRDFAALQDCFLGRSQAGKPIKGLVVCECDITDVDCHAVVALDKTQFWQG